MKRNLPVFAALAMSLISAACVPSLRASELDEKTIITLSGPLSVQGTILPAGQYVLKLQDAMYNRSAVSVFNMDETRLIATVLTIRAYRLRPTGKSVFSFYETAPGEPPALHMWFYPGDNAGLEFEAK